MNARREDQSGARGLPNRTGSIVLIRISSGELLSPKLVVILVLGLLLLFFWELRLLLFLKALCVYDDEKSLGGCWVQVSFESL